MSIKLAEPVDPVSVIVDKSDASDLATSVVLIGFWAVVICGMALLIFPTLPVILWSLLSNLSGLSTLGSPAAHLFVDLLFGTLDGVVIGLLRWRWRKRYEVVEEMVAAVASLDVVSANRIGLSNAIVHAAAGLAAGLAVALIGAHVSGILEMQTIVPGSPASIALGIAGGGGPGGLGGAESLISLLLALFVVIVLLSMFLAVIVNGTIAAVAGGAASGAAQGFGERFGIAIILAMTRLWTTEVTSEGRVARGLLPLMIPEVLDRYWGKPNSLPGPLITIYFDWLRSNGYEISPRSIVDQYGKWGQHLHDRGRGNTPRSVNEFVWQIERELDRREPKERLTTSGSSPALDGRVESFLYPGWFGQALFTGLISGALAGALQALLLGVALPLVGD